MTVFQCKMCGANLNITSMKQIIVCEYCGTSQFPFEELAMNNRTDETILKHAFLSSENTEDVKHEKHEEHKKEELPTEIQKPQYDQDTTYKLALARMDHAKSQRDYEKLIEMFQEVGDYKDARQKLEECKALVIYNKANALLLNSDTIEEVREAERLFRSIAIQDNLKEVLMACSRRIEELQREEQQQQQLLEEFEQNMLRKQLKPSLILAAITFFTILGIMIIHSR